MPENSIKKTRSTDLVFWRIREDSNPQLSVPKTDALSIELLMLMYLHYKHAAMNCQGRRTEQNDIEKQ